MNRCHVVHPKRENARIASCFHDLSPQVLDGMVMHGTDTSAPRGQRGLRCQTHPGHRDLFAVVRSGVRNECEEQYPYTGHFPLHGYPLWNVSTDPRERRRAPPPPFPDRAACTAIANAAPSLMPGSTS